MKTRLLPLSVVMILSAILSGCSLLDFLHDDDDKDDNGDKVFTEIPELTDDNYEEVIEAIDYRLDDFLAKGIEKPEDALPYIDELRQENWVEDVRLSEDAIVISVKNGGDIIIAEPDELGIGTDESRCNGIVNPDELLNNLNANLKLTVDKLSSFQNGGEIDSKELDRSLMLNSFQSTTCNESDKIGQTLKGTHFSNNHSSSISPQVMSEGLRPNSKLLYGCKNRKVLIANTTDGDITYREMTTYLDGIYSLLSSYFGIFDVDYIRDIQLKA